MANIEKVAQNHAVLAWLGMGKAHAPHSHQQRAARDSTAEGEKGLDSDYGDTPNG